MKKTELEELLTEFHDKYNEADGVTMKRNVLDKYSNKMRLYFEDEMIELKNEISELEDEISELEDETYRLKGRIKILKNKHS